MYDLTGKEIAQYFFPAFPGRKYLKMDGEQLSGLPGGFYLLKCNVSQVNSIVKIIKF